MSSSTLSSRINPHIHELSKDVYYHLGLDSSMDVHAMFGDVKYVLMAGSAVRARDMIELSRIALGQNLPTGMALTPIGKTERYTLYKFGCIICVSHGMGKPSLSILLHEITKLLSAAGVEDPLYVRIGTSGGLGIQAGTVIVSTGTVNGTLKSEFPIVILGQVHNRPTHLDATLAAEIHAGADDIPSVMGITMATDDFYEGQGRIDGCICEHTLDDKMAFLKKAHAAGVRNIEMESDCLVAFCTKMKIRCAVVCCALLNRLEGDQVTSTSTQLAQYADNAIRVVLRYVQKQEGITPPMASAARAAEAELETRKQGENKNGENRARHKLKKAIASPTLATAQCVQSVPTLSLDADENGTKTASAKGKPRKSAATKTQTPASSTTTTRAKASPVAARTRSRSPSPAPSKNGRSKRARR